MPIPRRFLWNRTARRMYPIAPEAAVEADSAASCPAAGFVGYTWAADASPPVRKKRKNHLRGLIVGKIGTYIAMVERTIRSPRRQGRPRGQRLATGLPR